MPAYIDENGYEYPNCGQTCGNVIIKNSIISKLDKCIPSIEVLREKDLNYKEIQKEFLKSMIHIKIIAIVRIESSQEKRKIAKSVEQNPKRAKRRLYYGTRASCDPRKILKNKKACSDSKCGMCSIIKYGTKAKLLRRGEMKFASLSSIAATNAYNQKIPRERPSTIFIIDVLTTNDTSSDVIVVERDA
ncbi:16556_t:CDS:2, partial [Racocetra persica]